MFKKYKNVMISSGILFCFIYSSFYMMYLVASLLSDGDISFLDLAMCIMFTCFILVNVFFIGYESECLKRHLKEVKNDNK